MGGGQGYAQTCTAGRHGRWTDRGDHQAAFAQHLRQAHSSAGIANHDWLDRGEAVHQRQADPRLTLKRFSLLCAQGAQDPRGMSRLLLGGAPNTAPETLLAGLELLAQLDTREALQAFRGPQLHLFAGQDGLVPAEAAGALFALLPDIEIGLIEQASHAFLLEDPHGVAGAIQAFLHECGDD